MCSTSRQAHFKNCFGNNNGTQMQKKNALQWLRRKKSNFLDTPTSNMPQPGSANKARGLPLLCELTEIVQLMGHDVPPVDDAALAVWLCVAIIGGVGLKRRPLFHTLNGNRSTAFNNTFSGLIESKVGKRWGPLPASCQPASPFVWESLGLREGMRAAHPKILLRRKTLPEIQRR